MLCADNTLLLLYLMSLQKIVQATYYNVLNYLFESCWQQPFNLWNKFCRPQFIAPTTQIFGYVVNKTIVLSCAGLRVFGINMIQFMPITMQMLTYAVTNCTIIWRMRTGIKWLEKLRFLDV
jgi:hypothetical protein